MRDFEYSFRSFRISAAMNSAMFIDFARALEAKSCRRHSEPLQSCPVQETKRANRQPPAARSA
jgi:hypothetical protein